VKEKYKERQQGREDEEADITSYLVALMEKKKTFERGSTRWHSRVSLFWNRLWTCRETDCLMMTSLLGYEITEAGVDIHLQQRIFIVTLAAFLPRTLHSCKHTEGKPSVWSTCRLVPSYQTPLLKTRTCSSSPGRYKGLPLFKGVEIGPGAHPASYSMGSGGSCLGEKRLGRKADHSQLHQRRR
jgi:hypothetical protein